MRNFYYLFKIHFISYRRFGLKRGFLDFSEKIIRRCFLIARALHVLTQSVANHIVDSIHRLMFSRSLLCDSIHHDFFRLVNGDASPSRRVIQIREHEVRLSDTHTSEFFVFVIDLTVFSQDNDDNQYRNVFSVFCFTKTL